jgi:hypothetical protein
MFYSRSLKIFVNKSSKCDSLEDMKKSAPEVHQDDHIEALRKAYKQISLDPFENKDPWVDSDLNETLSKF